ncbi:MAG TPA: CCA tRNA nucleotidyltransferase [Stellaceae bacterium]|nr:CCA tRNA nucleotidyltransferase [Stellaceae bacterium]
MSELHPGWLDEPATQRLLRAFAAAGIEMRFVGGCVRDALLGIETGDIDIATPARPEQVTAALAAAQIKALPTGIAHGTVSAVIRPRTFEITTLRRDVETFGRHARVAFDAGWAEDAARRDFTVNAVYLAPDGRLYDPAGGRADLAARRVRFVGDPATRIAEDVLRILRYYRFEARFGHGGGDPAARAACRDAVGKLSTLSVERVSRELLRLIAGPDPVRALSLMRDDGVLAAILPEATRIDRLERLIPLEAPTPTLPRRRGRETAPPPPPAGEGRGGGEAGDSILRLAALIDTDASGAVAMAQRLRLSVAQQRRLAGLAKPWPLDPAGDAHAQRRALYRLGRERCRDLARLLAADGDIAAAQLKTLLGRVETWRIPVFPLTGDDVTARGIAPGPRVGELLAAVRRWWEEGDFAADRAACLAQLATLIRSPAPPRGAAPGC